MIEIITFGLACYGAKKIYDLYKEEAAREDTKNAVAGEQEQPVTTVHKVENSDTHICPRCGSGRGAGTTRCWVCDDTTPLSRCEPRKTVWERIAPSKWRSPQKPRTVIDVPASPKKQPRSQAKRHAHKPNRPEGLKYRTRRGDKVRSKIEVIVADLLYSLDLSYEYERRLFSGDGSYKDPDFTVQHEGAVHYIEVLGMLHDDGYREDWYRKKEWYITNDFGHQIIAIVDSPYRPMDSMAAEQVIRERILSVKEAPALDSIVSAAPVPDSQRTPIFGHTISRCPACERRLEFPAPDAKQRVQCPFDHLFVYDPERGTSELVIPF